MDFIERTIHTYNQNRNRYKFSKLSPADMIAMSRSKGSSHHEA